MSCRPKSWIREESQTLVFQTSINTSKREMRVAEGKLLYSIYLIYNIYRHEKYEYINTFVLS